MFEFKKFLTKINEFALVSITGAFIGFIVGTVTGMAFFTGRHRPIWTVGLTLLLGVFHFDDLCRFFKDRNWLAFVGRLILLYAITASVVSVFVFALDGFDRNDVFDRLVFAVATPAAMVGGTAIALLSRYGTETRIFRELTKIADGLGVIGVWPRN